MEWGFYEGQKEGLRKFALEHSGLELCPCCGSDTKLQEWLGDNYVLVTRINYSIFEDEELQIVPWEQWREWSDRYFEYRIKFYKNPDAFVSVKMKVYGDNFPYGGGAVYCPKEEFYKLPFVER